MPLVTVMRVRELERRAGEAEGLACRSDVSTEGRATAGRAPAEQRPLRGLEARRGGLTSGQRRRFLRGVNEACRALNSMHGEETRPPATSLMESEDKNQRLRADVQQRVIIAALRWVDADSAVDEHEALAKLLKGRTGYASGVLSNVGSYEYFRVNLPDSVVDAPPLIDILPVDPLFFLAWWPQRSATAAQCAIPCPVK